MPEFDRLLFCQSWWKYKIVIGQKEFSIQDQMIYDFLKDGTFMVYDWVDGQISNNNTIHSWSVDARSNGNSLFKWFLTIGIAEYEILFLSKDEMHWKTSRTIIHLKSKP